MAALDRLLDLPDNDLWDLIARAAASRDGRRGSRAMVGACCGTA